MFCPNAADWGNIADWVSGIGTFAAVLTALLIAGNEHRVGARHRREAENQEIGRRAQIIAEAIRLAGEAEAIAGKFVGQVDNGGGERLSQKRELIDDLDGVRNQILALQQFPMSDPRLFAEIGRIAADCRTEPSFEELGTSFLGIVMKQLTDRMRARRDAIAAL